MKLSFFIGFLLLALVFVFSGCFSVPNGGPCSGSFCEGDIAIVCSGGVVTGVFDCGAIGCSGGGCQIQDYIDGLVSSISTATCFDGIQNQDETNIDCGGTCAACPTCTDGIQNQGEIGVDCGGPCGACATCSDGIQNQGETGVDCGGPCVDKQCVQNLIELQTSGNDQYMLLFKDEAGYDVRLPLAYTDGLNVKLGDDDDDLIMNETRSISKNDYIVVTSPSDSSFGLRYLGATKSTADSKIVRFKNLGTSDVIERDYIPIVGDNPSDLSSIATLNLGGSPFNIYARSSTALSNFDIAIDLNGDGNLGDTSVPIKTFEGAFIEVDESVFDNSGFWWRLTADPSRPHASAYNEGFVSFKVVTNSGQVDLQSHFQNPTFTSVTPESSDVTLASGTHVTWTFPVASPDTLLIDFVSP